MNQQYQTNSTEKVKGEDWCSHCKQDVDEWIVTFERSIHADGGYDKFRRCPHCNEMCLDDESFSLGCLLFFVGLFGSVIGAAILEHWGVVDLITTDDKSEYLFLVFAFVNSLVLFFLSTWLYRTYRHRDRPLRGQASEE